MQLVHITHHWTKTSGFLGFLDDVGPTCSRLAQAVAVSLAIVLDAQADARARAAAARPNLAAPDGQPPPAGRPLRLGLETSLAGAVGLPCHPAPSVSLGMGLESASVWSFALGGAAIWGDRFKALGGAVELGIESAWARLCVRALGSAATIGLKLCAEPLFGRLHGRALEGHDDRKQVWRTTGATRQGWSGSRVAMR